MTKSHPLLDGLLDLACRDGIEIRPTLLRVLTDLYVQKPTHSAEEENQYVELTLGLIEAVDAVTRAAVAASLSSYPAAPATILRKLVGTEYTLDSNVSTRDLAETENLIDLFFAADSEERRLILTNLDAVAAASGRRSAPASSEVIRRLETAALKRNTGEFSRMLGHALAISPALAERITRDHSGEPIVVAAKAFGMKAATLHRILLFLNPAIGLSVQRIYDLVSLSTSLRHKPPNAWWRSGEAPAHSPVAHINLHTGTTSAIMPASFRARLGLALPRAVTNDLRDLKPASAKQRARHRGNAARHGPRLRQSKYQNRTESRAQVAPLYQPRMQRPRGRELS